MKKRTCLYFIFLLILIIDTRTAMDGAREGIVLCLQTVIPSLFPFMVLTIVLTSLLSGQAFRVLRPVCRLFGIPDSCQTILLMGFLGGYPTGAQAVAQGIKDKRISRETGRKLLAYCSNAGPAFIFGMGANLFPDPWMCWAIWFIHILSAMLTALLFPIREQQITHACSSSEITLIKALPRSVRTMGMICGWVILFRVVLSFCQRWFLWCVPQWVGCLLCGILELSNGSCALAALESIQLRFILFSFLLGFGGICVAMQTYGVAADIDTTLYLPGKLLQALFSGILASSLFSREMFLPSMILIGFLFHKNKKGIAFEPSMMYNGTNRPRRKTPCYFAKISSPSAPIVPTPRQ